MMHLFVFFLEMGFMVEDKIILMKRCHKWMRRQCGIGQGEIMWFPFFFVFFG